MMYNFKTKKHIQQQAFSAVALLTVYTEQPNTISHGES